MLYRLVSILLDIAYISAGAAAGATLRYIVSRLVPAIDGFPLGTLIVNFVGSVLLGFVLYLSFTYGLLTREQRLLIATGFCGSLTTFSTFAYETYFLFQEGALGLAVLNICANVGLCILGVLLGRLLATLVH